MKLADKVGILRSAGFNVATEVRIRLIQPGLSGYAVADYIARLPGTQVFRIGEVKTGNAVLTKQQQAHYGDGIVQVLGGDASEVGLEPGEFFPAVWTGVDRFPGCPIE